MSDPYRAPLPVLRQKVVLAEDEPPPVRAVRVRAWSDGTTRMRIGSNRRLAHARADVSTVLVRGSGADAHLELQVERERVEFAGKLGYDEATLRWIAVRLRRAIEAAR